MFGVENMKRLKKLLLFSFALLLPIHSLHANESTVESVKEKTLDLLTETKEKTIDITKKLLDEGSNIAAEAAEITKEKSIDLTKKIVSESSDVAGKVVEKTQDSSKKALIEIKKLLDKTLSTECHLDKTCKKPNEEINKSI